MKEETDEREVERREECIEEERGEIEGEERGVSRVGWGMCMDW